MTRNVKSTKDILAVSDTRDGGVIQRNYKNVFDEIMSEYKVYCLSKRYDNMNLWAKYADGHHGFCLEFANQGNFVGHAMEVTYGEFAAMDVTNDDHININWFFCKGMQWSNEEEVRVLLVPRTSPHQVVIDPSCLTRMVPVNLDRRALHSRLEYAR